VSITATRYQIEVEDLWKRYYVTKERRRTLKEAVLSGFRYLRTQQQVWALQGVSFKVEQGQSLGIIGNNGAGKSTLLRLLSGLGRPTRGSIKVSGRIGTLLELGTGFHPDMTGRENIYVGGLVAGLTRQEVTERIDRIIDFAELEAVIDTPLRTYSTGMYMRLAFATAINYDPTLMIVDEALSVGDIRFQKKCLNRLLEMKRNGTTIVLVTHIMEQAQELCDEMIWLENGKARLYGPAQEVVTRYKERAFTRVNVHPGENRTEGDAEMDTENVQPTEVLVGTREIQIKNVKVGNEFGTEVDTISSGDPLKVKVEYVAHKRIERPIFMVGVFRDDGLKCYETSTEADNVYIEAVEGTGTVNLTFGSLSLMRGNYWLGVSIFDQNWDKAFDYRGQMAPFQVLGNTPGTGIFHTPHKWDGLE
jgi:lipopolysaccharide transport system ATP-binding protein